MDTTQPNTRIRVECHGFDRTPAIRAACERAAKSIKALAPRLEKVVFHLSKDGGDFSAGATLKGRPFRRPVHLDSVEADLYLAIRSTGEKAHRAVRKAKTAALRLRHAA